MRCDPPGARVAGHGAGPVRLALMAMATRFELVLPGDDPVRRRAIGEAALAEIAECEAAISPFRAGSLIARCNRQAGGAPVRVGPITFALLVACRDLHRATGGAFDPTIGPVLRALGRRGVPPADPAGLAEARALVGMDAVELDPAACSVRLPRPGMALDLGAIGKGHALELAAEVLRQHGVGCALLHGGTSSVLALGAPPGLPGWRIAVGPWPDPPVVTLRDGALSVSAPTQPGHAPDAAPTAHVVDPDPAGAGPRHAAVAVLAADARTAEAWSTALLARPGLPPDADLGVLRGERAGDAVTWSAAGARAAAFALTVATTPTGCQP